MPAEETQGWIIEGAKVFVYRPRRTANGRKPRPHVIGKVTPKMFTVDATRYRKDRPEVRVGGDYGENYAVHPADTPFGHVLEAEFKRDQSRYRAQRAAEEFRFSGPRDGIDKAQLAAKALADYIGHEGYLETVAALYEEAMRLEAQEAQQDAER